MSQLRIQLSWKMNQREARVLKSPHLAEGSTFFQITVRDLSSSIFVEENTLKDDGIRDLDVNENAEQENSYPRSQAMALKSLTTMNMGM